MPQVRHTDFPLDFRELELAGTPNQCLVLPPGFEALATPHLTSPEFTVSAEVLADIVHQTLTGLDRVDLIDRDPGSGQLHLVERTPVLRFRDDIWIEPVPLGAERSALAVYSRSRLGYSDLGVNQKRVERWLAIIAERLEGARRVRALESARSPIRREDQRPWDSAGMSAISRLP